jgi:hypothetical protein
MGSARRKQCVQIKQRGKTGQINQHFLHGPTNGNSGAQTAPTTVPTETIVPATALGPHHVPPHPRPQLRARPGTDPSAPEPPANRVERTSGNSGLLRRQSAGFRPRWYKHDARRGIASVVGIRKALPESIRRCIAFGNRIRECHDKSLR